MFFVNVYVIKYKRIYHFKDFDFISMFDVKGIDVRHDTQEGLLELAMR